MIVNAVITPMTQQILSQYYFYFGLHNCIFKKVGSVFYLYVTAMFLLLLWVSLSSSLSSPQQSPMTAGSDR